MEKRHPDPGPGPAFWLLLFQRVSGMTWQSAGFACQLGSLSTHVFETRTATGREHFACQDSGVSQIFILIISNGEKILSNVSVVVWRQVKRENSSLPVAVRLSKTRVLKLPISSVSPQESIINDRPPPQTCIVVAKGKTFSVNLF